MSPGLSIGVSELPPTMTDAAGLDHPCPFGPHSLPPSCVPALSLVSWGPFLSVPRPAQGSSLHLRIRCLPPHQLVFLCPFVFEVSGPCSPNEVGMGAQVSLPDSTRRGVGLIPANREVMSPCLSEAGHL